MKVIAPEPDQPELLEWWKPLLVLSRKARLAEAPWGVYIDEFTFKGWVKRSGRPTLSVYEYGRTRRDVMCDGDGDTHRFKEFAESPGKGRITPCDLDDAMFDAGVLFMALKPCVHDADFLGEPYVPPVLPLRRRRPYRPRSHPYLRLL